MNSQAYSLFELVRQTLASFSARSEVGTLELQFDPELESCKIEKSTHHALIESLLRTASLFPKHGLIFRIRKMQIQVDSAFGSSNSSSWLSFSLVAADAKQVCERDLVPEDIERSSELGDLVNSTNSLDGTVLLHSRPSGEWTGVTVALPSRLCENDSQETHGGTILLVEDEDFVRNITREVLEMSGYEVLEAMDAESGIKLFSQHADRINLLLTDVVMPGMNGRELAAHLLSKSPGLKSIFMSGYTENAVVREGFADPRLVYLQKPFTVDVLLRKVQEVLHEGHSIHPKGTLDGSVDCDSIFQPA